MACLQVAVHSADWQARVWGVVGWHIKQTTNKSAQDLSKGWRIRAADACDGSARKAHALAKINVHDEIASAEPKLLTDQLAVWLPPWAGQEKGWNAATRPFLRAYAQGITGRFSKPTRRFVDILLALEPNPRHLTGHTQWSCDPHPLRPPHKWLGSLAPKSSLGSEGHWRSNGSQSTMRTASGAAEAGRQARCCWNGQGFYEHVALDHLGT